MNEFWNAVTDTFNNREIAVGIWTMVGVAVFVGYSKTRRHLPGILKAVFHYRLVVLFGSLAANVAVICFLAASVGLWSDDQLYATVLWFFLSGCFLLGKAMQAQEGDQYFKNLFWGSFRVADLFEFIVVAFSFSLLAELILVPNLLFLGLLLAFVEREERFAQVQTFNEWLLFAIVIFFVWNAVSQIWDDPAAFFTTSTGLNLILPVLLTVGSIPLFYVWFCYSHIEQARIQIDMKTFQSDAIKRYAKKRFFLIFMARPWLLKRATRQFHILPAKEKADVDRIIQDIYRHEQEAANPPDVDPADGWSPYTARDFLRAHGLRTNDYHDGGYNDEWWAGSDYIDLDDHILPNKAAFYLEGTKHVVSRLKLTGKFDEHFDSSVGLEKLREITESLLETTIDPPLPSGSVIIPDEDTFSVTINDTNTFIKSRREDYPSGQGFEVFVTLTRHSKTSSS